MSSSIPSLNASSLLTLESFLKILFLSQVVKMIFSLLLGGEEPGFVPVISELDHMRCWAVAALGDGPMAPEFSLRCL